MVDLQVPDNMTAADVCKVTGQAIRLLLAGELRAREASALAQLCNSLYHVIPIADLETRVATLEEQVGQEETGVLLDHDRSRSHANETGPAAGTDARLEAEQPIPCPTEADGPSRTQDGDGTESRSNESDEAEEA